MEPFKLGEAQQGLERGAQEIIGAGIDNRGGEQSLKAGQMQLEQAERAQAEAERQQAQAEADAAIACTALEEGRLSKKRIFKACLDKIAKVRMN